MKKYVISREAAAEIRRTIKVYEKTSAFRKLQVAMLMGEGENVHSVSKITLYHPTYIYEIVKQYCTLTFEEFVRENRGGANRRNLTDEQEQKILDKFKEKAVNGQVVDLSEVKAEYENERGKETANSTFYNFLHRMDWRRVMPRSAHPKKASDEEIESSKKLTLNSTK